MHVPYLYDPYSFALGHLLNSEALTFIILAEAFMLIISTYVYAFSLVV